MYNSMYDNFFRQIKKSVYITHPINLMYFCPALPYIIYIILYFLLSAKFPLTYIALSFIFIYLSIRYLGRMGEDNNDHRQEEYMNNKISHIVDILQDPTWDLYNIDGLNLITNVCTDRINEMEQKVTTYNNMIFLSSIAPGILMFIDKIDTVPIEFLTVVTIIITSFLCIAGMMLIYMTNISSPLTLREYKKLREDIIYIMYHMQKEQTDKNRRQEFEKILMSALS